MATMTILFLFFFAFIAESLAEKRRVQLRSLEIHLMNLKDSIESAGISLKKWAEELNKFNKTYDSWFATHVQATSRMVD